MISGMEIDFPRGGTPKSLFRTTQSALAKKHTNKLGTKRGATSSATDETARTKKKSKADPDASSVLYENVFRQVLTPELLTQNVRGLAFVKFIGELELMLECAEGIQLSLPATQISRAFTGNMASADSTLDDLFHKGQALAFRVTKPASSSTKGKKVRPTVTVCPHAVNNHLIPSSLLNGSVLNGAVASIEEKGAIIDLGLSMSAVQGFVQEDDLPVHLSLAKLRIGQVALFRVKQRPSAATRIIRLSGFVEMNTVGGDDDPPTKFDHKQLMPGSIVQCEPEKVVADGIFVGITNGPKAYIRKVHLPPRLRFDPSRISKSLRACVLCSQPNSTLLILSAHPDIVALSKPEKRILPQEFKIGSRVIGRVFAVDKQHNIYFKLGSSDEAGNEKQLVTAKALRIHIDNVEQNLPNFSIGSDHECRVVGSSMVERQLFVTTRSADLQQKVICAEEAQPGMKLTGVIKAIRPSGLTLSFGQGFVGHVLAMHATDRPNKKWPKLFQRDQKLTCRVLYFDQTHNRLSLTAKKSLIKQPKSERLISDIGSTDLVGVIATGVVIKRLEGGSMLVAFYNRVVGLLPASKVSTLPSELVAIGMPIRVRVKSVDAKLATMVLEPADQIIDDNASNTPTIPITNGQSQQRSSTAVFQGSTKVLRPAKPFQLYSAQVLGPWTYGGTAPTTTAELLLPGGSIGRLHVSELGLASADCAEGSSPMQTFLNRNKGKSVNVKVICVSRPKSVSVKGREELMEKRQTDRIVECTAVVTKMQEPRKKLTLIKYRDEFNTGDLVPVFITDCPATNSSVQNIYGEINPDFRAIFQPDRSEEDEEKANSKLSSMLFDSGELRYGRVMGVNKTKKCHLVQLSMVHSEEMAKEELSSSQQIPKRKRKRTVSTGQRQEGADESEKHIVEEPKEEKIVKEGEEKNDDEVEEIDAEEEKDIDEDGDDDDHEAVELATAEEYEQLITAHPHSIPAWIGFIRFYRTQRKPKSAVQRHELGKEVAERALKCITFQNDSDLARLWRTYLSLEVSLGTEDSLREVFVRACAATKSLEMHKYLIGLLKKQANAEGREGEIREVFESMVKKFRHHALEPWFDYGKHLLQRKDTNAFRQLLKRALHCTEKRKHLTILTRFAQLEERHGDRERAKTMQELIKNFKEGGKAIDIAILESAVGGEE